MKIILFCLIFLISTSLQSDSNRLKALYHALDPLNLSQTLAFYELYSQDSYGRLALERAMQLLAGGDLARVSHQHSGQFGQMVGEKSGLVQISGLCTAVNRFPSAELSLAEMELVEHLAAHLPNRLLKGYRVATAEEMYALPPEEIDLGRALLLSQLGNSADAQIQVRKYSALLDLMALQILTRVPLAGPYLKKIEETNRFIFEEMGFRFPPHSVYTQEIDLYTFLPSVMDNHLGVCLGVAALYLAIAQRIALPLEAVTPPGHIYVRCVAEGKCINIETTARGIHAPTERYLGVNTYSLCIRNHKEVVGMTHFNQASIYLQSGEYEKAAAAYERALLSMADDPLVKELLGYTYLFIEKTEKGKALLQSVVDLIPEGSFAGRNVAEDYLSGNVDEEGIKAIYLHVDETRESILKKNCALKRILSRFPDFREGLLQCAVTWIQLKRNREALEILEHYHAIDPSNPVIEYYLAQLNGIRMDYRRSWKHLNNAEAIVKAKGFSPKALCELRLELSLHCPEWLDSPV